MLQIDREKKKQTGKQRNRCPTLLFKKFASLAFNHYLSYSHTLLHYMYHQNSQLFQYVKCVIDNSHLEVHYTVENLRKRVEVTLFTFF